VEGATITSSAEDTGYPDDNIIDWKDYTLWQASGAQAYWLKANAGSQVTANCFAVAGHNLDTVGVTRISLDGSNNDADWTEIVADFSPPNGDDTFAKFFTQVTYQYYRLDIDNNAGGNFVPQVGIFYVGNYLELPRKPSTPHDPDEIEELKNSAEGGEGHLIGDTSEGAMRLFSYNSPLITQAFGTTWITFRDLYRGSNFVWLWDYENKPNEAYLMRIANKTHKMAYTGLHRHLTFDLRGRMVE
jgi:hypothetical protein